MLDAYTEQIYDTVGVKALSAVKIWWTCMSELHKSLGCAATTLYSSEVRKVPRGARAHENHPGRDGEDRMKHTLAYFDKDEGTTKINIRWMRMSAKWWQEPVTRVS